MVFKLQDIVDLDYFLALDEKQTSPKKTEEIAARDRDIFRQVNQPDADGPLLLRAWLEYRKLLFSHETNYTKGLPGNLFSLLFRWTAYLLLTAGGMTGLLLSWSFLAYHGVRPVNVTLFFTLFILIPLVLSLATTAGILFRRFSSGPRGPGLFHALVSALFMKGFPKFLGVLGWGGADKAREALVYVAALARNRKGEYGGLFFWSVFILSSLFAAAFSAGVLGGTLFRVATADVAFGWQSTLAPSPMWAHDLVSFISLPWSWWAPQSLAGPTAVEIEGSRIILKQGISALSTAHLASWWPFLCFSLLFYTILPRLALVVTGVFAGKAALTGFDFNRPRFRRLIIRMKSPIMDIRLKEDPVTRPVEVKKKAPVSSKPAEPAKEKRPSPPREGKTEKEPATPPEQKKMDQALILADINVFDSTAQSDIRGLIQEQFFLEAGDTVPVTFDVKTDAQAILAGAKENADTVILLQEVWQPPIRGLLYYITELKRTALEEHNLWILLTRTPGEGSLGLDAGDTDFQVWRKTVLALDNADIRVERIRP